MLTFRSFWEAQHLLHMRLFQTKPSNMQSVSISQVVTKPRRENGPVRLMERGSTTVYTKQRSVFQHTGTITSLKCLTFVDGCQHRNFMLNCFMLGKLTKQIDTNYIREKAQGEKIPFINISLQFYLTRNQLNK